MDEKILPDGFPLGFIKRKTFGCVYMGAVANEFCAKYPGRDFDGTLWKTCGLSIIYLEGDEDYFYLGNFICKMGLDEAAIKAVCEAQGFDYAKELKHWLTEQLQNNELRILATSDANVPESMPLLLGLCHMPDQQEEMQVLRLWTVDMEDGELRVLREFPLHLHQSFYVHSVGCCSVNVSCSSGLAEQVRAVLSSADWNGSSKKRGN